MVALAAAAAVDRASGALDDGAEQRAPAPRGAGQRGAHGQRALGRAGFTLGIGAGHAEDEHAAIGQPLPPPADRVDRLEEAVVALRRLLDGETVTTTGPHLHLTELTAARRSRPMPVPLLVGGGSRAVLRVAARHADIVGLTGFSHVDGASKLTHFTADALAERLDLVRGLPRDRTRAARGSRRSCSCVRVTDDRRGAAEALLARVGRVAAPDRWTEVLASPFLLLGTRRGDRRAAPRAVEPLRHRDVDRLRGPTDRRRRSRTIGSIVEALARLTRAGRGAVGNVGAMFRERADRVRARMAELGVDVLLLSVGPDLPYLTGYEAMPLERLTMLVLPARRRRHARRAPARGAPGGRAARRVRAAAWDETDDPIAIVADLVGAAGRASPSATAPGPGSSSTSRPRCPSARFTRGSEVIGPLRARKDAAEVEALRRAGAAADRVAAELQAGDIELVGRTEAAGVGRARPAAARRGPPPGELRHRGRRAPTPPARTTSPATA